MEKSIHNLESTVSIGKALEFVEKRKNIFAKSVRKYVESQYPIIIKEISYYSDGSKTYWYWCFLNDKKKYIIYSFNRKLTNKEYNTMMTDIITYKVIDKQIIK